MSFEFVLREAGSAERITLARAYGRHMTRGRVALYGKEGKRTKFISLLAAGGRFGCDGVDEVRYAGATLAEFDEDGERQWKFHPGTRSTGYGDPVQGRPEFFPDLDFTFTGKCYIEVLLPEVYSDDEGEPERLQVFFRGLKVPDITEDVSGNLVEGEPGFYYDNARVGLDLWRDKGKLPLSRFHRFADTWVDFKDVSGFQLDWDNGTETVQVPRYDAHVVFPDDLSPAAAFEAVMFRAPGCMWQDVNGAIRILTDPARASVHTLSMSNVVRHSFAFTPKDPESIPNFFIFFYRDVLDPLMKEKQIVIDLPELRDRAGGILNPLGPIHLGVTTGSLAQRIARCRVRVLTEKPFDRTFGVGGQFDSIHVARNDYVDLTHARAGASTLLARVARESFSPKKGERKFTVQLWSRDYYSDTDHGPEQGTDVDDIPNPAEAPPVAASVDFDAFSLTLSPGASYGTVTGAVTFAAHPYAQRATLHLKLDGESTFSQWLSTPVSPPSGSLIARFMLPNVPAGSHELKAVTENERGARLPLADHPAFPFVVTADPLGDPAQPPQLTDADAPLGTTYFSTTQNKLVFKDYIGDIIELY